MAAQYECSITEMYLRVVKKVSFMLHAFYHNKKLEEKEETGAQAS